MTIVLNGFQPSLSRAPNPRITSWVATVPELGSAAPNTQAKNTSLGRESTVNALTLTISMIADKHDFILDIPRDNANDVPDGHNFGINYEDDR